jgi:hypothetical protein
LAVDERWPEFGARTDDKRDREAASAAAALPLLLELVPNARSLAHVGFGGGAWLAEAQRLGVSEVLGIDGPWADVDGLLVSRDHVVIRDTRGRFDADGRKYDVALCIEYAEHLSEERAGEFVAGLANLAPVVAFSAAIPGQGGTGHVNEQWPSYWAAHFAAVGYRMVDAVRHRLWAAPGVPPYLAQNLLVAVEERRLSDFPELAKAATGRDGEALSIVHPSIYEQQRRDRPQLSFRWARRYLRHAIAARADRRR